MIVKETELPAKHLNLWKKGQLALEQKNWEYAVSLILPIVKETPGFLDGRKALRAAEGNAAGGKRGGFSLGGGGGGMFGGAKKDPWEAIADLEENVFPKDPFSASANQKLYDLATKLQFPDLAAFALETIRAGSPTNTKNLHALANHYMSNSQFDKAGEVYGAIAKADPRDMTAVKGEKDAAARQSIHKGAWDQGGSIQSKMHNSEEAKILEMLARQGRTPEQTQEVLAYFWKQYEKDPENINTLRSLGQLHDELGEVDRALEFYAYALTKNPGDVALQRLTEMTKDKANHNWILQMEEYITSNPDAEGIEDSKAQLAQVRRERASGMISEAKARVERNPTDKNVRYDLGQAYFNAAMFTEAIPELQQAKGNPHIRIKAMLMLGRCFEKKNMNDLAKSALTDAAKELSVMDATKKEVLYELALVHEKMSEREPYLEALKEIYNADYGYKDVAKRVESSYQ